MTKRKTRTEHMQSFHDDLRELLKKYSASMSIEDVLTKGVFSEEMVVSFDYPTSDGEKWEELELGRWVDGDDN